MPRAEGKASVNNFVGGLVTDFHELNQPPNTTVDEDNCDLDRKGSRRRRLGIDFESGYELSSDNFSASDLPSLALGNHVWEAVNNDGNRNFLVVQVGATLYYYDLAVDPVSSGAFSFTTDLTDHKAGAFISDAEAASTAVSIASGKGVIFVSGGVTVPFYVEYDADTDDITETNLFLQIRDFKLQSGETDYEAEPTSVTPELKYDYYNQGWYKHDIYFSHPGYDELIADPILDHYYGQYFKYPPLSKAWWIGQADPDGDKHNHRRFDISWYKTPFTGNLLAPLGHYVVSPFHTDRSGASGIAGFEVEVHKDRPTAVAFYAGKAFYGWKNKLMFSQTLIDDFGVAARCYQTADPTAADINGLVATDGGVIELPHSGTVIKMVPFENSLILFCTNGVWALGGSTIGSGFAADSFALYKVSSVGAVSSRSVIDVDGVPVWWSKTGVYTLQTEAGKQGFAVQNLCKDKVQLFYDAIPGTSKLYASGAYDRLRKIIVFVYNSGSEAIDGNPYFCNRVLNYDTILGAWFPYTISDLTDETPRVADVFALLDVSTTSEEDIVVDALGETVVDAAAETVVVDSSVIGNFDNQSNIGVKYLTFTKETISG